MSTAIKRITWEAFRDNKLLWYCNRILHIFGIAIVFETDEHGNVIEVYPAEVTFRGFSPEREQAGYEGIAKFISKQVHAGKIDIVD